MKRHRHKWEALHRYIDLVEAPDAKGLAPIAYRCACGAIREVVVRVTGLAQP